VFEQGNKEDIPGDFLELDDPEHPEDYESRRSTCGNEKEDVEVSPSHSINGSTGSGKEMGRKKYRATCELRRVTAVWGITEVTSGEGGIGEGHCWATTLNHSDPAAGSGGIKIEIWNENQVG